MRVRYLGMGTRPRRRCLRRAAARLCTARGCWASERCRWSCRLGRAARGRRLGRWRSAGMPGFCWWTRRPSRIWWRWRGAPGLVRPVRIWTEGTVWGGSSCSQRLWASHCPAALTLPCLCRSLLGMRASTRCAFHWNSLLKLKEAFSMVALHSYTALENFGNSYLEYRYGNRFVAHSSHIQ